jgi:hypothetical protein
MVLAEVLTTGQLFKTERESVARMCVIAESNMLLRAQTELPKGFNVATETFADGWHRMRSGGLERLEKKVRVRGWNFIKIADCDLRSGVGDTSETAIVSAISLALRRMDTNSNAVNVQQINLTQYPWFWLARVCVQRYRIQQGAELPAANGSDAKPARRRRKRVDADAAALVPQFGAGLPVLKQMLIVPGTHEASAARRAKAR